jgi:hypothetical protein
MACETGVILNQFQSIDEYKKFVDDSLERIKERKDLENVLID